MRPPADDHAVPTRPPPAKAADSHRACHCCGLIHRVPMTTEKQRACCTRCGSGYTTSAGKAKSASRTAAAACGAFVLFWPAVLLPILRVEKLGQLSESSLLSGIVELLSQGSYLVGGVVLVFSVVFPLGKIVMLLELSLLEVLHRKHKAITLRIMEHLGRWSMMDVMLLAFLVMLVKLGNLVEFRLGPGVFAFVGCVTMSMIASLSFDPHSIWEDVE